MLSNEINDLLNQIEQLSNKDQEILITLNPTRPVSPTELASELYVLPKDVYESIDNLKAHSFVELAGPKVGGLANVSGDEQSVVLTNIGKRAQVLTTLKQSSSAAQK